MVNVFFLILYAIINNFLSGIDLYILLSIHLLFLIITHLNKKLNPISPIFIYYVGVIFVNIGNISLVNLIESGVQITTYSYIIPKYIKEAATIWCISSTMFIIGYNLYKDKQIPNIGFEIKSKTFYKYVFIFLLVENILFILGSGFNVRSNQVGKIFVLLNTISILFFARIWAKENNKTYGAYAITLYLLETYSSLLTSYLRFELILPTFYLFTGYFIGKGHIKYIFTYRIIPLFIILIIYAELFTVLPSYRANFINAFQEVGKTNNTTITYGDDRSKNASSSLISRSANVAQMTNIVNLVEKNNGPYGGKVSAPIITALVPRFLWPDKPIIQLGAWFAVEIGAGDRNNEYGVANNSVNMTVAGELYLDFGWIGVLAGSLLLGGFIAILWNATNFYSSAYNLTGTIFGGYLIMLSIGSYADLQIVVTLLSTYIIFYTTKRLALYFIK